MATITIKNIPTPVYARLKRQALEHRRSLNQEVILRLERSIAIAPTDPATFLAQVRALRVKPRKGPLTDRVITKLKRQGRL
jgi:plasmid stability protein